jgi:leader peptidase (prepilin peptidase)/N-methyltransferase
MTLEIATHASDAPLILRLLLAGCFGAILGSFWQATLARLLIRQSDPARQQAALSLDRLNPLTPRRSFCFRCGHVLRWWENVPVLSFCLLQGRCRACQERIPRRSLLMELGSGWGGSIFAVLFSSIVTTLLGTLLCSIACAAFLWRHELFLIHLPSQKNRANPSRD